MLSFRCQKKFPRFSVIVPTYNRSRFIVPTLESALGQTHAPFEIIVVGDGCTDNSEQVVRQKFGRAIRWISLPDRSGSQSAPNNSGIQVAAGTHIAYLGHDDIWSPHHLELLAAVFKNSSPDFAVSGCIYHGPPGSKYYQFTGLFEDPATVFREFFPPSSIAHQRDLIARIGCWRDPRKIKPPVDCEFLLRAAHAGCTFQSTNAITVHKFAAGHRYLSYRWPSCEEQQQVLLALQSPTGQARVLSGVMCDILDNATVTKIPHIDFDLFPPGDLFQRNLCAKGLLQPAIEVLQGRGRAFAMDNSPAGLDWFPLEVNPRLGQFRWSGPNPNPRYFLPIACANSLRVQLRILKFAEESLARALTLELNDRPVTMERKSDPDGASQFRAVLPGPVRNGLKLQFHLPRNAWRGDHSPARFAGFALSQVDIEPVT
jgi:hypothetical protein